MNIILVSPHPDDIALCLGGWLGANAARLHDRGTTLTLLTVFSRTTYAPHASVRGVDEVSQLRAREEEAYARRYGLTQRVLGLPDCSCLGLGDEDELVAPDHIDPRRALVEASVAAAIADGTLLVAPLGIGGHVDHRLVRAAVARAAPARPCLWYEDLPYALDMAPGFEWGLSCPVTGGALSPWLFPTGPVRAQKRRDLLTYQSQLTAAAIEAVLDHQPVAGAGPTERVWVNDGSLAGLDPSALGFLATDRRRPEPCPGLAPTGAPYTARSTT